MDWYADTHITLYFKKIINIFYVIISWEVTHIHTHTHSKVYALQKFYVQLI